MKFSKNVKQLTANLISLSFLQVVRYILPLIFLPYLTDVIGIHRFGDIAIANSIMLVMQAFVNYGFDFSGARDVARAKANNEMLQISVIFSNIIWTRILLFLISFAIVLILTFSIPALHEIQALIIITVVAVFFTILFPEWLFQGLEEMQYITIINVITRIIFVVSVFCFIKTEQDYIYYPLLNAFSFLLAGIASIYIITCKKKIKLLLPKKQSIKTSLKDGFNLFINQICVYMYQYLPNFFLGVIKGPQAAGIYDAAARLINAGNHGLEVITRTFFPFLSRKLNNHPLYAKYSLSLSALASLLVFIFAPLLFKIFYADEFEAGIIIMRILSASIFFTNLTSVYGTNYLILLGEERILRNIVLIASIVGLLLLIPTIHFGGYIGAAFLTVGINAAIGISVLIKSLKLKGDAKDR